MINEEATKYFEIETTTTVTFAPKIPVRYNINGLRERFSENSSM